MYIFFEFISLASIENEYFGCKKIIIHVNFTDLLGVIISCKFSDGDVWKMPHMLGHGFNKGVTLHGRG